MARRIIIWALVLFGLAPASRAEAPDAAALFSRFADRIVQVRLIDREAGRKAGLGTGFLVAESGLVATNYHVISDWVRWPGRYRLEYAHPDGQTGALELLNVDVVNDLALLRSGDLGGEPLQLSDVMPSRGQTIYSLGNPHDIGFTVIPGTYNGLDESSYYEQIHFSGSINAGMSGGPVLDTSGSVVGVNVATAGNQLSFLVPATALGSLLEEWRALGGAVTDFTERIRTQLLANQEELLAGLLAETWPTGTLGDATTVGELNPFVKCWGDSTDDDKLYIWISSSCHSGRQIYLEPGFGTGVLAYQFFWLEPGELGWLRFRRQYESLFGDFVADNAGGEDHVTEFVCDESFVESPSGDVDKAVLCLRSYHRYAELYDALYLRGSVDDTEHMFLSHFTLSGVTRDSLSAFLARFQEVVER